ncbi:hypothetical protein DID88_010166 [Monilinia fructigena]|uniref:FAD-binding domain-containing protein n=1 Tax=Monilinia fructigena TaxID=38457 RepID=A0A395IL11_9HELO|nr:hypothetical protein DID88_010166 [Monilinia fructigena]
MVTEDQPVWHFGLAVWNPREENHKWDNRNGRITLAGDAAHTMTYQRGQGLNHSIADAGKLVEFLKTYDQQSSAISNYEEEMTTRAGEEVNLSVINKKMLHDWSKVIESPVFKNALTKKSITILVTSFEPSIISAELLQVFDKEANGMEINDKTIMTNFKTTNKALKS